MLQVVYLSGSFLISLVVKRLQIVINTSETSQLRSIFYFGRGAGDKVVHLERSEVFSRVLAHGNGPGFHLFVPNDERIRDFFHGGGADLSADFFVGEIDFDPEPLGL